jgi:hypothetical protein
MKLKSGPLTRRRNSGQCAEANDFSPPRLSFVDGLVEEIIVQQVFQPWIGTVRLRDIFQEDRADDATTAPHQGNFRLVQFPIIFLGGVLDEHEALGVGDNLGCIQGLLQVFEELLPVTSELGGWASQNRRSLYTLLL